MYVTVLEVHPGAVYVLQYYGIVICELFLRVCYCITTQFLSSVYCYRYDSSSYADFKTKHT